MPESIALLTIFVLAAFTGYEVISKVSTILHTPLMSGANAIHGVVLVGAIIVTGNARGGFELGVGLVAVGLATLNLVGGFVVTDRMLHMFAARRPAPGGAASGRTPSGNQPARPAGPGTGTGTGTGTAPSSPGDAAASGVPGSRRPLSRRTGTSGRPPRSGPASSSSKESGPR